MIFKSSWFVLRFPRKNLAICPLTLLQNVPIFVYSSYIQITRPTNTDTQKYSLKFQQNSLIPEAELLSTYSSPSIVFSIPNYNIHINFSDRCFRTSTVSYYTHQHCQPGTTYSIKRPKNFNCYSKTKNNTITLTRISRDLNDRPWIWTDQP